MENFTEIVPDRPQSGVGVKCKMGSQI